MKKLILLISLFLLCFVGYVYKESLLSSYAKAFEKEVVKEQILEVFEGNKFLFSPIQKQNFTYSYEGALILGGNPLIRLNGAIALYKSGIVKKIYITQPKNHIQTYNRLLQSEFEKLSLVLSSLKIPYEVVQNPRNGATSTLEEARDFVRFAKENNLHEVLILTDSFHTSRAYDTFESVFKQEGLDTKLYIIGVPNPYYNTSNWWKSELGLRTYIVESGTTLAHWLKAFEDVEEY